MMLKSQMIKILGVIGVSAWLLCLGPSLTMIAILFGEDAGDAWKMQSICGVAYVVFGLLPIRGLTRLLKRSDNPIDARDMTVLAIFAASPLWFFLLLSFT